MKTPWSQTLIVGAHAVACFALVSLTGCTTASQTGIGSGAAAGMASAFAASTATVPVPTYTTKPVYPWDMRRAGITGTVNVRCLIDESGRVRETEVINTTGDEFVRSAVAAVRQWTFSPALVEGRPVAKWVSIPIRFDLSD